MNKSLTIFIVILMISMISILLTMIFLHLNILTMLIFLIIFSLSTALNLTKFFSTSLESYMTFMMMTGGIMIIFTFFISLISNQFFLNKTIIMNFFMFFFISMILYFMYMYIYNKNFIFNLNQDFLNLMIQYKNFNNFKFNKLYTYPLNLIILMMMFYLLFSLTFISKILLINSKPLRKKNYV